MADPAGKVTTTIRADAAAASWDALSARNSCEHMSETLLLFRLQGVLRKSVQSETELDTGTRFSRSSRMDRIARSAVGGLDGLQSTRASISPRSGESTVGQVWRRVRSTRSTPSPHKQHAIVHPCFIDLQIPYSKHPTPFPHSHTLRDSCSLAVGVAHEGKMELCSQ
jgi:hypothetical protein